MQLLIFKELFETNSDFGYASGKNNFCFYTSFLLKGSPSRQREKQIFQEITKKIIKFVSRNCLEQSNPGLN